MNMSAAELLRQVKSQIEEVDPAEVNELRDEGVTIVDVRGSEEFATGHLPGAKGIPRGHLESRIDALVPDRGTGQRADAHRRFPRRGQPRDPVLRLNRQEGPWRESNYAAARRAPWAAPRREALERSNVLMRG